MLTRFKWIALFIILSASSALVKAQTTAGLETKVTNGLTAYYKKYPQEKIFIQTSQHVYATGQTIWYKLYATAYGKPSVLSKIVYVQLVNAAGKVTLQNKLPLTAGIAHGNIDLPDSLKTGWYQLKGFTRWMINFGDSAYYHQPVYIQNPGDTLHKAVATAPAKYQVTFYPEGGDMIAGNPCNIAFKAIDDHGLPVVIDGDVLDNNKAPVAKLVTTHNGMGVFNIAQVADANYTAVIHFPDKTVQRIALPAAKKEGITIQVNAASPNEIQLKLSYTGPPENYKDVLLTAFQNNGKIVTYPIELERGINPFSISTNIFTTGIVRFTVFDHAGIPVAERLVFIDKHDQLSLQLKADTLSAQPRAKQVFTLVVKGADGKPVNGNFSVSVTDESTGVNDDIDENIFAQLLLSSELKGNIYRPAWYFMHNNDSLHQQLDLVMLTNGWRHFKWMEVLQNDTRQLCYPVEGAQYIAGKIIGYQPPLNEKDQLTIKLIILNQDSSKFVGYVTPDSTGRFILNDYNHNGLSTLFMEATDKKNKVKKLKISLYNTIDDSLRTISYPPPCGNVQPFITTDFLSREKKARQSDLQSLGINLSTVFIKDKKLTPTGQVLQNHISPVYTVDNEYTLDLVNNPTVDMSLVDYIRGRFPGLRIDQDATGTYFTYMTSNTLQRPDSKGSKASNAELAKPYVFLNESQVPFTEVEDIPLQDVALIRFAPPPVFFAPYNGGNVGALLIYTRNSTDQHTNWTSREQFDQYTFNGYTITREFSAPNYSGNENMPADNHSTLYWAHDLNADRNGNIKFRFCSSGNARKYHIVIVGMNKDGRLGTLDEVFN